MDKLKLLKSISLNDQKCEETLKNESLSNELSDLIVKVKTSIIVRLIVI
jgi:hypothetical protein